MIDLTKPTLQHTCIVTGTTVDGRPAPPCPACMAKPKIDEVTVLPDGSAFCVASFPLPTDHWIYEPTGEPPMPFRVGLGAEREKLAEQIRAAGRYAIKAATMSGKEMDFDPDAMLQNLIVGLLGYWTESGKSEL